MRRREFITLLFGAALTPSRDALGQASAKIYRLGRLIRRDRSVPTVLMRRPFWPRWRSAVTRWVGISPTMRARQAEITRSSRRYWRTSRRAVSM